MAKQGKGYNQSMFTNKDGYAKGGVNVKIPSQNIHLDPRAKTSIRGRDARIPSGDKVTVKGTGKARKQTATWY